MRRCVAAVAAVVAALGITGTASAATNGMIAFGGENGMRAMNANGTGSVPLFTTDQYYRGAWSPDGNALAVLYWPDSDSRPNVALARLNMDDGVRVVARDGALPTFSPNSKRIAYARYVPATDDTEIRVVDADGTDDALVRSEPDGYGCAYREFGEGLWWLPDGRLLYLCIDDIVTINPDGTGHTVEGSIPDDHATMYDADLSPDGTRFAGPWGEGDVNVWNWTTSATGQLTSDGDTFAREWMTWSPDGMKILYAKGAATTTIPAGGGGETVLSGEGGSQYAWQPCVAGTTVTCSAKTLNGTLVTTGGGGTTTPPTGGGGGSTTGGGGGTTTPPAFTAFDAKPAFSGAAKATDRKIVVKIRCDAKSTQACAISLTATTAKAVASKKRKKLVVAKSKLTLAPGRSRKVTLKLTAKARKVLKRERKLKLVLKATSRRSDGKTVVAKKSLTIKKKR
jgi:hypothetical protein